MIGSYFDLLQRFHENDCVWFSPDSFDETMVRLFPADPRDGDASELRMNLYARARTAETGAVLLENSYAALYKVAESLEEVRIAELKALEDELSEILGYFSPEGFFAGDIEDLPDGIKLADRVAQVLFEGTHKGDRVSPGVAVRDLPALRVLHVLMELLRRLTYAASSAVTSFENMTLSGKFPSDPYDTKDKLEKLYGYDLLEPLAQVTWDFFLRAPGMVYGRPSLKRSMPLLGGAYAREAIEAYSNFALAKNELWICVSGDDDGYDHDDEYEYDEDCPVDEKAEGCAGERDEEHDKKSPLEQISGELATEQESGRCATGPELDTGSAPESGFESGSASELGSEFETESNSRFKQVSEERLRQRKEHKERYRLVTTIGDCWISPCDKRGPINIERVLESAKVLVTRYFDTPPSLKYKTGMVETMVLADGALDIPEEFIPAYVDKVYVVENPLCEAISIYEPAAYYDEMAYWGLQYDDRGLQESELAFWKALGAAQEIDVLDGEPLELNLDTYEDLNIREGQVVCICGNMTHIDVYYKESLTQAFEGLDNLGDLDF